MCLPDHAAEMKELFPQLLQVAGKFQLSVLFRDCLSWREPPCSRSCPLSGVAYSQWLIEAVPVPQLRQCLMAIPASEIPMGLTEAFAEVAFQLGFFCSILLPLLLLGDWSQNTLLHPKDLWHPNLHLRVCSPGNQTVTLLHKLFLLLGLRFICLFLK